MRSRQTDALTTVLLISAPWLTPTGRRAVAELVDAEGQYGSAERFARSLGLRDRHQLSYVLRRSGLPPLQSLGGWIKIMMWVMEYENGGRSLCQASLSEARDPAYRYRLVKRVTGLYWSDLKARGLVWVVQAFLETCRPPAESYSREQSSA
jgi:hypothetical protein